MGVSVFSTYAYGEDQESSNAKWLARGISGAVTAIFLSMISLYSDKSWLLVLLLCTNSGNSFNAGSHGNNPKPFRFNPRSFQVVVTRFSLQRLLDVLMVVRENM